MEQPDNLSRPGGTARECNMEIVIGALVALLAIAAIVASSKFPGTGLATDVGSARFPRIYSGALIILCGILIAQNILNRKRHLPTGSIAADASTEKPNYPRTFAGILSSVLCLLLMPYLGYATATAVYVSFLMWTLGMRHKALNPLLAVSITGILYFTFSAGLNVPLPTGSLFE